jgi:hypothetical protein
MKLFGKYLLIYVCLGIIVTYAFGWVDLIGNKQITGNVVKDILHSVSYYFTNVLIYWQVLILIGATTLAAITWAIRALLTNLTKKRPRVDFIKPIDTAIVDPSIFEIKEDETAIIGNWLFDGSEMLADHNCKRVEWLTSNYLNKIAKDYSGWETLYKDPNDNRYWESTYLHSEMHGGGPKSLVLLSKEEAIIKYKL